MQRDDLRLVTFLEADQRVRRYSRVNIVSFGVLANLCNYRSEVVRKKLLREFETVASIPCMGNVVTRNLRQSVLGVTAIL